MDAPMRGRGTTRRTLTPSTTFLITWRYTDAMSIGPDVPTPRTENGTSRPRAFGSRRCEWGRNESGAREKKFLAGRPGARAATSSEKKRVDHLICLRLYATRTRRRYKKTPPSLLPAYSASSFFFGCAHDAVMPPAAGAAQEPSGAAARYPAYFAAAP